MERRVFRMLVRAQEGAAYVEYVILAAVAILVLLGTVQLFFGGIRQVFERLIDALSGIL